MKKILAYLDTINDKCQPWKIAHKLRDIVVIVLLAMLANVEYWEEIEDFAKFHKKALTKFLNLKNGVPSHDTIQRLMATISPEAMSELLVMWADLVTNNKKEKLRKIFNIDGKTIRGNRSKSQKPLHIVSAFSKDDGVCYGQTAVNKKSNEITAIPALLDTLKVKNCIITIDAAGTYTNIAEKIISKKCDYCLAVKKNQKTLYEDIIPYFQDEKSLEEIYKKGDCYQTIEKARGGLEQRDYYILSELDWLKKEHPEWPKLESIGMTTNTITREGKATKQTRFYIQSFKCSPEEFARTVRDHWAIESMHWLLDVVFREDANKTLNQTAAQNLNILRKLSLAILKTLDLGKKMSYRRKRFNIALKFEEMIEELFNL